MATHESHASPFNEEDPADRPALAHLGSAMIVLWNYLPSELQERIFHTVDRMSGAAEAGEVRRRLERLIENQAAQLDL